MWRRVAALGRTRNARQGHEAAPPPSTAATQLDRRDSGIFN
jgi:hypothetical protein